MITSPPQNEVAEMGLLGAMIRGETSPSYLEDQGITANHFHCHRIPFNEIAAFARNGGGDISLLVMQAVENGTLNQIGGAHFYTALQQEGIASALPKYVQAVRQAHGKRLVMQAGGTLAKDPTNAEALAQLEAGKAEIDLAESLAVMSQSGTGKFQFVHMDELHAGEGAFDFVEDCFTDGAASVIYGASNSGKTFFALDLAAHVATGTEWQGKEVERGAVLYIALEGKQGAVSRVEAMRRRGILPEGSPFYLCFAPVDLLDPSHPGEIVRLIKSVTAKAAFAVRLVIIDTLARAMAGGDENAGKDMGEAVKTIDAVRAATGAHVCIIHHCGKDVTRGGRGHSSLRAAIDSEIEVTHPEGDKYRVATIVKQRDLPTIAPLCFSLDVVEVGTNRRGKPITSCVVKAEDEIMIPGKKKPGAKRQFTCEMILELLPQPSISEWKKLTMEETGMSGDTFHDRKRECRDRWEKVGNQIALKPLKKQGKWGNGEIAF